MACVQRFERMWERDVPVFVRARKGIKSSRKVLANAVGYDGFTIRDVDAGEDWEETRGGGGG